MSFLTRWSLLLLLCLSANAAILAQRALSLSLTDVVALAKNQGNTDLLARTDMEVIAPDSRIAATQFSNSYWQYQQFLANYRPQITLNATLPAFSRSIDGITQPDGTIRFVSFNNMQNRLNLSLSQPVARTGGRVFVNTGIRRIDIFDPAGNTVSFFSNPISFGFEQPLWGFNDLKWEQAIAPLRYQEAELQYSEDMEAIARDAVRLFFDVYIAGISLAAAEKDKLNADTLYTIAQGRYSVGKIAETELLQIEIAQLNADAALATATLDLQTSTENLRNFLGIRESVTFTLAPPTDIPDVYIDPQQALTLARQNRSKVIEMERRLKEAERNVASARRNNGFDVALVGSFGLSQTDATLAGAYRGLLDQEQVSLSVRVPIMDWGRAKSRQQIATSNQQLIQMNVEQERISFERDVLLKVKQFEIVKAQTRLALKNYEVAQKTYDLTRKRYLIGKIGVIDLNLALADQDRSRRAYMSALRNFWLAYYDLRRLTLYDFIGGHTLRLTPDPDGL